MDRALSENIRLLVAVPTMGSLHAILADRLIRWSHQFLEGHIGFYFSYSVSPVDRARNQIVEFFLRTKIGPNKDEHFTHLLMVDSDTVPPPDAIQRLLSHDQDVVSGLTPIVNFNQEEKAWEVYDNCFERRETNEDGSFKQTILPERHTGLREIFRCGASCLLIKREVFEKLDRPYFRFISNAAGTQHVRSEDIDFCDRVTGAGFKIYADTDVCCTHTKPVTV